jgi:four helix bundle protein
MDRAELQARTKKFALRVMKMTDALPRSTKAKVLAAQILRSATSVTSGYRAACRARSKADWIDKIGRTLEEVDESLLWLELIEEGDLVPARRLDGLKREAAELTAVFTAIHKSSRS